MSEQDETPNQKPPRRETGSGEDKPQQGSRWRDPRSFRSVRQQEQSETGAAGSEPGEPAAPRENRRPDRGNNNPRRGDGRGGQNRPRGQRQGSRPQNAARPQNDKTSPPQSGGAEGAQGSRPAFRSQPKRPLLGHLRAREDENTEDRPRGSRPRSRPQSSNQPPDLPIESPEQLKQSAKPPQPAAGGQKTSNRSGRANRSSGKNRPSLQPRRSVDPNKLRPTLTNRALKSLMRGPKRVFKPGKPEPDAQTFASTDDTGESTSDAPVYRSLAELMEADRKARNPQQQQQTHNSRRGQQRNQRSNRRQNPANQNTPNPKKRPEEPLAPGVRPAPSIPIPTTRGIKARSTLGSSEQHWWARRWIEAMETIVDAHRLQRGRTYARDGQVLSIEESPYGVEARVQGSRREPYKVTFQLTPLTDEQWEQVIDKLSEQARFTAQLLAGEMPHDIESAFESAQVGLFPQSVGDLYTSCSCPDWANPCKHVAATHYILADRFDDDPFLLFRMRGRTQEQILDALRRRRLVIDTEIPAEAPLEEVVPPPAPAPVVPLVSDPQQFWNAPEALENLPLTIKPPAVDMPVLKLLGQPAFLPGKPLQEVLGPVYQSITYAALRAAYSEDTPVERSADDENGATNGKSSPNASL